MAAPAPQRALAALGRRHDEMVMVRVLAQAIMEAEVSELTGVPKGERDPERRLTSRNGYRDRRWDTRVGSVELAIPRVRDGSYGGRHRDRRSPCRSVSSRAILSSAIAASLRAVGS